MKIAYPYTIEQQEDGGYLVQFLDIPEAYTEGATVEEATFNAQEVLSLALEQRLADEGTIPTPSRRDEVPCVAPAAAIQSALLIHLAREAEQKSLADLARALGTSWPSAARLEDPKHWPSLRQLDRAAAALGKRLVLTLE